MFSGISVTRGYVRFLFESRLYEPKQNLPKPSNEEPVMYARTEVRELAEGDWQLPSTDDDHTGEDV